MLTKYENRKTVDIEGICAQLTVPVLDQISAQLNHVPFHILDVLQCMHEKWFAMKKLIMDVVDDLHL